MSKVCVLVDGENIDRTLRNIFNSKPRSEHRPRWDRVRDSIAQKFGDFTCGLFFLNASTKPAWSFVTSLRGHGWTGIQLTGSPTVKIVDVAILKTLAALKTRDCDVVLMSHDADFCGAISALCDGKRKVTIIGFREFIAGGYNEIPNLEFMDLEDDMSSFDCSLPRNRVVPIDKFDPARYLENI